VPLQGASPAVQAVLSSEPPPISLRQCIASVRQVAKEERIGGDKASASKSVSGPANCDEANDHDAGGKFHRAVRE
jgi:hypothetical protein